MGRTRKAATEPAVNGAAVDNAAAAPDVTVDKDMNGTDKENDIATDKPDVATESQSPAPSPDPVPAPAPVSEKKAVKTVKSDDVVEEPLRDSDEIEVVSLIPNVGYKDANTADYYEWDRPGHVEYMTYETIKVMWRNAKGYFRNMWLKPCDDRVIKKLGLANTYAKYEFLMNVENYTADNIDEICATIESMPREMKVTLMNKAKDFVVNGNVSDIKVIRAVGKQLGIDLISFVE